MGGVGMLIDALPIRTMVRFMGTFARSWAVAIILFLQEDVEMNECCAQHDHGASYHTK